MVHKYIRGVKDRGSEVISELVKLGGDNYNDLTGEDVSNIYYIGSVGNIIRSATIGSHVSDVIVDSWEEIRLDPECEFSPFQKVLVRDSDDEQWVTDIFSHVRDFEYYRYQCIGNKWHQCIPYEGNEDKCGKCC